MTQQLPKSTSTNQTGRLGVTILQSRLEQEGWIFRRQDGDSDFGVDGEIEVVDRNHVTGRLIKCQIKSSASISFETGEATVQARVTTHNLWRATPVLTLLFYVDISQRAIYWTPALAHHPRPAANSMSIRFEEANNIQASVKSLQMYLDSWFSVRSSDALLREIVPFHHIYEQLKSDVDHYDAWTEMNDDEDERFCLFYGHALRLRLEVGLSNAELPTMDDWYMRSAGIWDSAKPMFRGTFSEAMKVIGQAYEKAFEILAGRLSNIELTVENQDVWNFIKQRTSGRHVIHTMQDSRANDPQFHARIEAALKNLGALQCKFSDRKS